MNFKKILLVSLLLAIFTLGAVSATDNLTAIDAPDLEGASDVDVQTDDVYQYSDDDKLGDDPEVSIVTDEYNRDYPDTALVEYYFPENYTGSIYVSLDDVIYYDEPITTDEKVTIEGWNLNDMPSLGIYDMVVCYYGGEIDSSLADNVNKQATLTVTEDMREPDYSIDMAELEFSKGEDEPFAYLWFEDDVGGNLTIFIDEVVAYEKELVNGLNERLGTKDVGIDKLDYGKYTAKFVYSGDEHYLGFTREYDFEVSYGFNVGLDDYESIPFGTSPVYYVSLPTGASGNVEYTVNGKKFSVSAKDLRDYETYDHRIVIDQSDLKYGYNEIFFSYVGDDYPLKTINSSQSILSEPKYGPRSIDFDQSSWVSISLPGNAKGNLKLYEGYGWDEEPATLVKSVALKDGFANITIDNMVLGSHSFYVEYDGSDYSISYGDGDKYFYVSVDPILKLPRMIYSKDSAPVASFKVPSNYKGDLNVTVGDETRTFAVKNGEAAFNLFNIESASVDEENPDAAKSVNVQIRFDDENMGYSYEIECPIMITDTPADIGFNVSCESEAFKTWSYEASLMFQDDAEGHIDTYVDGIKVDEANVYGGWVSVYFSLENISIGKHSIEFRYSGDGYYAALNKTAEFEVVSAYIIIPNVVLGQYEYPQENNASVALMENATGSVTLKVDNKEIKKVEIAKGQQNIEFDLSDLALGTHTVEISYAGNYPSFTKKQTIKADYRFSVWVNDFSYGGKGLVHVTAPIGATGKVTAKVNTKTFTANLDENGTVEIDISDLTKGEYTVFVTYDGDSNFPKMADNYTFTVDYAILSNFEYGDNLFYLELDNATYSLSLPKDADGNLEVCEFGGYDDENGYDIYNVLGSVKLVDGRAELSLDELSIPDDELFGEHDFRVRYTGDDYELETRSDSVTIKHYKYIEPGYEPKFGEDVEFKFVLSNDSKGNIQVFEEDLVDNENVWNFLENISVVDGKAVYSLTNKCIGHQDFKFVYDDGVISFEEYGRTLIWPSNVTVNKNAGADDDVMTVTLPSDAKGKLFVLFWRHGEHGENYTGDEITVDYSGSQAVIPASKLVNGTYVIDYFTIDDEKYGFFNFRSSSKFFAIGFYEDNVVISGTNAPADDNETHGDNPGENNTVDDKNESSPDNGSEVLDNATKTNATAYDNTSDEILQPVPDDPVDATGDNPTLPDVPSSQGNETVLVDPKITASNLKMYYNDGSYFKVLVYGTDGNVAAGESVVFKLNGKKLKTVNTDANGYAKVKITGIPKTYKISATALGVTVTKKLTVKKVLSLKKVKVKKSAKKLVLTATLKKVKGKYLKGKKITFKFNGKKYKVKTNKKGVAKLTIDKSVLLKLKAGKKIKYQATYIKSTVKYTVKVAK